MASSFTQDSFISSVLKGIGAPDTSANRKALRAWVLQEGGHWNNQAKFNPLNTTQAEPNSKTFRSVGAGAADIRIYGSPEQGVQATVETLKNGRYGGILSAFRSGRSTQADISAIESSPWGTGKINTAGVSGGGAGTPGFAPGLNPDGTKASPTFKATSTPGVDNSGARNMAILDYFQNQRGKPGALLALKDALDANPDIPSTINYSQTGSTHTAHPAGGSMPSGVGNFEGKQVDKWIIPILKYARQQGWKGSVNSGYRSYAEQKRIYDSGVRPAAKPGQSNHEGDQYPRGAVDVSQAAQLSSILKNSPYANKLVWAGGKDPVHFSHPHNGSY